MEMNKGWLRGLLAICSMRRDAAWNPGVGSVCVHACVGGGGDTEVGETAAEGGGPALETITQAEGCRFQAEGGTPMPGEVSPGQEEIKAFWGPGL